MAWSSAISENKDNRKLYQHLKPFLGLGLCFFCKIDLLQSILFIKFLCCFNTFLCHCCKLRPAQWWLWNAVVTVLVFSQDWSACPIKSHFMNPSKSDEIQQNPSVTEHIFNALFLSLEWKIKLPFYETQNWMKTVWRKFRKSSAPFCFISGGLGLLHQNPSGICF